MVGGRGPTCGPAYNFRVKTVSLAEALAVVLDAREKHAQITTDPKAFFVHVRVPDHVSARLGEIQRRVLPDAATHEDIDHVTLVYTQKPESDHAPEKVHAALESLRRLGERTAPIDARIQGWAYFDGASKGGKPHTALVALLDAPGLEHLHVDAARALGDHGIEASKTHVFTPHITLGYLPQHGRADKHLEPVDAEFTIDAVHVASRDNHEVPLAGAAPSIGQKAAAAAWRDRLSGGKADDKKPSDFSPSQLSKGERHEREHTNEGPLAREIAMDHLAEDPRYYDKLEKVEKDAALNPTLRAALIGGGVGAGAGLLGSAADYANDSAAERAQQPLWKRMLVNGGIGAVGGGIVGATHGLSRPSPHATSDLVDSLNQQRFASVGEEAAAHALRQGGR